MKLSEAIRLGAMLSPQAYGTVERTRRKFIFFGPLVRETCALGAAFEAANVGYREEVNTADGLSFRGRVKAGETTHVMLSPADWPMWSHQECPFCGIAEPLNRLIPHFNDAHRLTRELIADFVQQVENRQEAAQRDFVRVVSTVGDELEDELAEESELPCNRS